MRRVDGLISADSLRLCPETIAEERLAEFGRFRREQAVDFLKRSLGGFDVRVLSNNLDGAVMALLEVDPAVSASLAMDRTFDRYISEHEATHPFLARATQEVGAIAVPTEICRQPTVAGEAERPSIVAGRFAESLHAGDTYIIHRVDQYDRGALRSIVESLEHVWGYFVQANCYLSRDGATGFGTHWDDHHVLVLQVQGSKVWEVFRPTHLSPLRPFTRGSACGEAVWSGVLTEGQALFIPRGWSHRVIGLDELSIHYTVALSGSTFRHVFDALGEPPSGDPDPERFRSWLASATQDVTAPIRGLLAFERASIPTRGQGGLLDIEAWDESGGDPRQVSVLLPGGAVFQGGPSSDGSVRLGWSGAVYELLSGEVEWLCDMTRQWSGSSDFAKELLAAGLARVVAE